MDIASFFLLFLFLFPLGVLTYLDVNERLNPEKSYNWKATMLLFMTILALLSYAYNIDKINFSLLVVIVGATVFSIYLELTHTFGGLDTKIMLILTPFIYIWFGFDGIFYYYTILLLGIMMIVLAGHILENNKKKNTFGEIIDILINFHNIPTNIKENKKYKATSIFFVSYLIIFLFYSIQDIPFLILF